MAGCLVRGTGNTSFFYLPFCDSLLKVLVRYVTTKEKRSRRGRGGAGNSTAWETMAVSRCRTKLSIGGQMVGEDNIELGPY